MHCLFSKLPLVGAPLFASLVALPLALAQPSSLSATIVAQAQSNTAASESQKTVDKLADETARMLEEYRGVLRRVESLDAYNDQIEKIVTSQNTEIASMEKQLARLETTNREVVPLMLKMIDTIAKFVELDVPFLTEERSERVARLREVMDRADVTTSEKYRRILEAYQVEMEYGRTIESYRGPQVGAANAREVDFLRFGRIGLYFQTLDGEEVGMWDQVSRKWVALDDSHRFAVREGLQIARKQIAPDLIKLPVPAPVAATAK